MKGYKAKHFYGVPVKIDPNTPPGQIYFLNDKYMEFTRIDARNRKQRVIDFIKKCYNQHMKKTLFIVACLIAVIACVSVAAIQYNDHKQTTRSAQKTEVQKLQAELKLHDAVAARNQTLADEAVKEANGQRLAICSIVKTTKAAYDLTLCQ